MLDSRLTALGEPVLVGMDGLALPKVELPRPIPIELDLSVPLCRSAGRRPARETLPRTLNEGEVETLIEKGARDAREHAILEVLYGTGLRAGELCQLAIDDVDLPAGLLCVRQGKGRKDRVVPFGERVKVAVLAYLRECRPRKGGPLFLSVRGRPLTRGTLENLVWKAGQRAGLVRLASPRRLCHSSTQVYLGIETKDLERMIERSHPRERVE